ncbi:MAG: chromate transporter [Synergistaceae bacterium]|jgi:chromate transporter|nr:chromate transporter [Synergistaceae bacterium]
MIYLELILGFLKVGCFAFGGAYGAIPLIRDVVLSYGWLNEESLTYLIAVSESTPGPIMVNLATFVGSSQAGFLGAVVATVAVVLPSFFVILILMAVLKNALKNAYVKAVLQGLKPSIIGIILAMGIYLIWKNCFPAGSGIDPKSLIITILLAAAMLGYKKIFRKQLSPILLIVYSSCMGMIVYGL